MPRYLEVVQATTETATKILTLRATGRAWVVNVTTNGGRTASVAHKNHSPVVTLNMPTLPPDAVLTRAEADRLVAFIVHECCHVLHTNAKQWERACAAGERVRIWTNCLEDVRIEQAEIKAGAFPAMHSLLASMSNHLHSETLASGMIIGNKIDHAPYVASILGRIANDYHIPAAHALRTGLTPDVNRLVAHALTGLRRCRTTTAVVDLALALARMEQPQPQPLPQHAPGEPQEAQGGQDALDEPQEGQDGQDAPGGLQEGQEGQDGQQEGQDGQDGQATPDLTGDADLTATVRQIAARAGIDQRTYAQTNNSHALATVRSTIDAGDQSRFDGPLSRHYGDQIANRLPRNSVLHGQIGRLLVSEEIHRRTHHESSGRLDRRALVRMRAGAVDIYSRRDDTPGMDTALLILIDGSMSMSEPVGGCSRMGLAQTTAWHITKAAEAANAKVCVAVFHTPTTQLSRRRAGEPTGAAVTVIKPWSVPIAERAGSLAAVAPDRYTPLAPAIMTSADMLAGVNASRHILMVLTDGECDYGNDAVQTACRLATDLNVETVGIGMACAHVIAAFPPRYSINVTDLTQLANTGLGVLVRMLEDANPRAGGDD